MSDGDGLARLDAEAIRRWYRATLAAFERHRRDIDRLNVFPVPDGDTGTNLAATMTAACERLDAGTDPATVAIHAAQGALLGARGNSGVILAQLLRGLADSWRTGPLDAAALASGLRHAATAAAEAVAAPAEGTILTVAHAAAATAHHHRDAALPRAATAVADAAVAAVAATVEQLPALTRAGVVDAGGLGLALMLDTLAETVTGDRRDDAEGLLTQGRRAGRAGGVVVPRESGSSRFGFEVQYLLDTDPDSIERLRAVLVELGDSLVVVGAAAVEPGATRTWNVHVHVNDVGAAVEAGIRLGTLHRLSVTRFADESPPPPPAAPAGRGCVVVTDGPGLVPTLLREGARPVIGADDDIGAALRATGAADVVVLAGADRLRAAETAAAAARSDGFRVAVVPIRSAVQALAALAVRDAGRRFDDDVIAMAEAAASCRAVTVTVAESAALTTVGRCEPGDLLVLADDEVVLVGRDPVAVLTGLADRLCAAGAELLTLVRGADLPPDAESALTRHLAGNWPLVESQWFDGGHCRDLLWIGAE
ncbi:hypothetical protein LX16_0502 [Stackebrandtia albiflava]|uniref:DhaL domain-containing protein n=1 Tax=Stackebrandtia albiflava TaxID=406432 RepID=A0A562VA85_9ACTN|nr:DAK2 domain-containing protein [Stackebrandtia albiflava]TWJ14810.1 hypothetical protein LX16_0502 [Stackebrandtia albiflava]